MNLHRRLNQLQNQMPAQATRRPVVIEPFRGEPFTTVDGEDLTEPAYRERFGQGFENSITVTIINEPEGAQP